MYMPMDLSSKDNSSKKYYESSIESVNVDYQFGDEDERVSIFASFTNWK